MNINREDYINIACKYYWILSVVRGIDFHKNVIEYNVGKLDNVMLERFIIERYMELKEEIVYLLIKRRNQYELNRDNHKEQKTAEKQFYRFIQATGYTLDVSAIKLPIKRLIQIYSVYFQDLKSLKKSLDKKNLSPYID